MSKSNAAKKNDAVETITNQPATVEQTFSTQDQLIAGGFTTKSAQIRELRRQGMKTGDIAKQVGVIYQHAYNVINKPLKKVVETPATPAAEQKVEANQEA